MILLLEACVSGQDKRILVTGHHILTAVVSVRVGIPLTGLTTSVKWQSFHQLTVLSPSVIVV